MKKRFLSLLLALCLTVLLTGTLCVCASEPQLNNVTDAALLLTDDEAQTLDLQSLQLATQYGVGVYIVTVDDYCDFDPTGVYEATYGIYHEYTMGVGDGRDGIMLLLSMRERDFALFCYGENAQYAFNDYAQQQLEDAFLDYFANDDWNGGFAAYLRECEYCLEQAAAGEPVSASPVTMILIFCGVSLVIAAIVCAILAGQMKTVHKKTTAGAYAAGGLNLTQQFDQFTHRTETRRKIERNNSSSNSQSHSGGGGSGRSGKF